MKLFCGILGIVLCIGTSIYSDDSNGLPSEVRSDTTSHNLKNTSTETELMVKINIVTGNSKTNGITIIRRIL